MQDSWFYLYIIIGLPMAVLFGFILKKKFIVRRSQRLFNQGAEGEELCKKHLKRNGFKILETQPVSFVYLKQGDREFRTPSKPDFLVEKNNEQFIVECKSGDAANLKGNRFTRRQILEYHLSFPDCEGVLLYNSDEDTLERIEFLHSLNSGEGVSYKGWKNYFLIVLSFLGLVKLVEWGLLFWN